MLVLLFLAVTSATSAELIAVSSILTYDVYKRYINPEANERQLLRASQAGVSPDSPSAFSAILIVQREDPAICYLYGPLWARILLHWCIIGLALCG